VDASQSSPDLGFLYAALGRDRHAVRDLWRSRSPVFDDQPVGPMPLDGISPSLAADLVLSGGTLLGTIEEFAWALPRVAEVFVAGLRGGEAPSEGRSVGQPQSSSRVWDQRVRRTRRRASRHHHSTFSDSGNVPPGPVTPHARAWCISGQTRLEYEALGPASLGPLRRRGRRC